jgi:hypothetical protein
MEKEEEEEERDMGDGKVVSEGNEGKMEGKDDNLGRLCPEIEAECEGRGGGGSESGIENGDGELPCFSFLSLSFETLEMRE